MLGGEVKRPNNTKFSLLLDPDPWMAETKETFQIFPPLMFHEYIDEAGILHPSRVP